MSAISSDSMTDMIKMRTAVSAVSLRTQYSLTSEKHLTKLDIMYFGAAPVTLPCVNYLLFNFFIFVFKITNKSFYL